MTSVLLADDHPFILAGLEAVLRASDYQIVGMVSRGDDVLAQIPKLRPDILILDVEMPGRTGPEVLRTLRSRGDQRIVVLLTASLDDQLITEVLDLGVQGIVLKDGAQHSLLECLDTVRSGGRWVDQRVLQRALEQSSGATNGGALGKLSSRERGVVALVARGLRNKEIAAELGISEGTVKVNLHRIYMKLGINSRTELTILVKDSGLA
jgi:two-component system nitrate/nitrite response regulator NarP